MFSHNFLFSIFAGVAVGGEFLKQCEISRFANFCTGYEISQPVNFRTSCEFPPAHYSSSSCPFTSLQPFVSCAPLIFPDFLRHNHQPPIFIDFNWA